MMRADNRTSRGWSKRIWALLLAGGLVLTGFGSARLTGAELAQEGTETEISFHSDEGTGSYVSNTSYLDYLDENNFADVLSAEIIDLDIDDYDTDGQMEAASSDRGVDTGDRGRISWTFEVEESGFYNMDVGYYTLPGTRSNITRRVLIDREVPYEELDQILFHRLWEDSEIQYAADGDNEIRPTTSEILIEDRIYLRDQGTLHNDPLVVYLSAGRHELSFVSVKEPLGIASLSFSAAPEIASYDEYRVSHVGEVYYGEDLIGQAERIDGITKRITKNSPSIIVNLNYSDPTIQPSHSYHMIYNTIGAESWQQPGDSVTWQIEAPEAGWYYVGFKSRQHLNRGVTAYRRLEVNGTVPYAEAKSLAFDFSGDMAWHFPTYNEEPVRVYLEEGLNTISLETVLGEMGPIVTEVQESLTNLNNMYLRTVQLTGQAPDRFIDYEVARKIPDFRETMTFESERLYRLVDEIVEITGEKGERTAILEKMAVQAGQLSRDPESVTEQIVQLQNNISGVATWIVQTSQMPLEVDSIHLFGDVDNLPATKGGLWERFKFGAERFFATFFVQRASLDSELESEDPLRVWMVTGASNIPGSITSGLEQAQILRGMINDTFTPLYGKEVELELIPTDVVLRSALAGIGPDVIVGLGQDILGDFAMRDALMPLNGFEDFEEVSEVFIPSALTNSSYQQMNYGLPEQQTFMMMFYRDDILADLGLEAPETWTDVRAMIPLLQMNNYEFYLPNSGYNFYNSLVFQYGGDLYQGEGTSYGIQSGLDETAALDAFSDYTGFFTTYKLPVEANFANRFRTGEMPIGISEYSLYNQLEVFAPEIRGKWSFAPLPAFENEDGTLNRSYVPNSVQSAIMAQTDQPNAAWEFIEWWTSAESQVRYGNTVESILGAAARYFPANPDALRQLPWSTAELDVLMSQLESTVGVPAIPGYYMHTRMVQYAFNDVVVQAQNPREALYLNIRTIDEELSKKREEFGLDYMTYRSDGEAVNQDGN